MNIVHLFSLIRQQLRTTGNQAKHSLLYVHTSENFSDRFSLPATLRAHRYFPTSSINGNFAQYLHHVFLTFIYIGRAQKTPKTIIQLQNFCMLFKQSKNKKKVKKQIFFQNSNFKNKRKKSAFKYLHSIVCRYNAEEKEIIKKNIQQKEIVALLKKRKANEYFLTDNGVGDKQFSYYSSIILKMFLIKISFFFSVVLFSSLSNELLPYIIYMPYLSGSSPPLPDWP